MSIEEKISNYKALSHKLINCQKALEDAIENRSVNQEEIYIKSIELRKSLDEGFREIKAMSGE